MDWIYQGTPAYAATLGWSQATDSSDSTYGSAFDNELWDIASPANISQFDWRSLGYSSNEDPAGMDTDSGEWYISPDFAAWIAAKGYLPALAPTANGSGDYYACFIDPATGIPLPGTTYLSHTNDDAFWTAMTIVAAAVGAGVGTWASLGSGVGTTATLPGAISGDLTPVADLPSVETLAPVDIPQMPLPTPAAIPTDPITLIDSVPIADAAPFSSVTPAMTTDPGVYAGLDTVPADSGGTLSTDVPIQPTTQLQVPVQTADPGVYAGLDTVPADSGGMLSTDVPIQPTTQLQVPLSSDVPITPSVPAPAEFSSPALQVTGGPDLMQPISPGLAPMDTTGLAPIEGLAPAPMLPQLTQLATVLQPVALTYTVTDAAKAALTAVSVYQKLKGPISSVARTVGSNGTVQAVSPDGYLYSTSGGGVTAVKPGAGQACTDTAGDIIINNGDGTYTKISPTGQVTTLPYQSALAATANSLFSGTTPQTLAIGAAIAALLLLRK